MENHQNIYNHLSLSITEGRLVRDLLDNSLLDYFIQNKYKTTLYSEASNVSEFTNSLKMNMSISGIFTLAGQIQLDQGLIG